MQGLNSDVLHPDVSKANPRRCVPEALCLSNASDFAKQVASYSDNLRLLKSAGKDDIDHAAIAHVLNDLAAFYSLHWALGESERCYMEALKLRSEIFGRSSLQTVKTLHEMGTFYLQTHQYEKGFKPIYCFTLLLLNSPQVSQFSKKKSAARARSLGRTTSALLNPSAHWHDCMSHPSLHVFL
jgi:hypothetical protein